MLSEPAYYVATWAAEANNTVKAKRTCMIAFVLKVEKTGSSNSGAAGWKNAALLSTRNVVSYCAYGFPPKDFMVVHQFAVSQKFRGRGIGLLAMKWAVQQARIRSTKPECLVLRARQESVVLLRDLGFLNSTRMPTGNKTEAGSVFLEISIRSQKIKTQQTRADLIRLVFAAADTDKNGLLSCQEMCKFSAQAFTLKTGFQQGGGEIWEEEFRKLCKEHLANPSTGINAMTFGRLVEDKSDRGIYCTNKDLRTIIKTLQKTQAKRADLVRRVFTRLDADRDGFLNQDEMMFFAKEMGFPCNDVEWAQDFQLLCTGGSYYCTDVQLRNLLLWRFYLELPKPKLGRRRGNNQGTSDALLQLEKAEGNAQFCISLPALGPHSLTMLEEALASPQIAGDVSQSRLDAGHAKLAMLREQIRLRPERRLPWMCVQQPTWHQWLDDEAERAEKELYKADLRKHMTELRWPSRRQDFMLERVFTDKHRLSKLLADVQKALEVSGKDARKVLDDEWRRI